MIGNELQLHKLVAGFVADRNSITTDTVDHYDYTGAGSDYVYTESSESFVLNAGNGNYTKVTETLNISEATDDVEASVRTVEILPFENFVNQAASLKMFLKRSITRALDYLGEEVFMSVLTYENNANVTDKDPEIIAAYEDPKDVNQAGDTYSRLNGTRNFIAPEIPLPSDLTKTVSVELQIKNEGTLHDLTIVNSGRNEVGGD
jgi:hypothetical protein